jgi:predicted transcriptional regulator
MIIMAQFTTAEVAEKFATTPRTLRKFLRADARANGNADALPGKGSRYALEGKDLQPLKKRFAKWTEAEAVARAERAAKAAQDATEAVEADDEVDAEG